MVDIRMTSLAKALAAVAAACLFAVGITPASSAAPPDYDITTTFDGRNTVVGSARHVGGEWYLTIEQRAGRSGPWNPLAGGPQRGRQKRTVRQQVTGGGYDFSGYWRTCVTTRRGTPRERVTCGAPILVRVR